jgi:hypothetical protein
MKLVNFIFALTILTHTAAVQPAESVPPDEMLRMCNSLSAHAGHAVESRRSKVPLAVAVATTAMSLHKKLAGVPADVMERYQASVREIYQRVYALQLVDLPSAHQEVIPACISYARGQYTTEDLQQMKHCDAKTWPYFGFANLRDMGISLDQQLEWLQEKGLKNAPGSARERERLYSILADMIKYVYAHPDLSKRTIYEEQFESCMDDANPYGG